jgi:hypothetical protein
MVCVGLYGPLRKLWNLEARCRRSTDQFQLLLARLKQTLLKSKSISGIYRQPALQPQRVLLKETWHLQCLSFAEKVRETVKVASRGPELAAIRQSSEQCAHLLGKNGVDANSHPCTQADSVSVHCLPLDLRSVALSTAALRHQLACLRLIYEARCGAPKIPHHHFWVLKDSAHPNPKSQHKFVSRPAVSLIQATRMRSDLLSEVALSILAMMTSQHLARPRCLDRCERMFQFVVFQSELEQKTATLATSLIPMMRNHPQASRLARSVSQQMAQ